MFCSAKERILTIPAGKMRYITFGRGAKPMVIIQGLNTNGIHGSAAALSWMYRLFTKTYTVYLFDRREEITTDISVRELALDLAQAMDALSIAGAHVLGVSQGGMIGQYLAIDRPDLVEKLVLAVTASRNNPTVETAVNNWITQIQRGHIKEFVADMAVKLYSERYVKQYLPFLPLLKLLQKPKDPCRFIRLAKSCLTCSAYDELEKIQCPVFVIGGREDQVVGSKASEEIAKKLNCKLFLYEDLGHAAYEEAKDFNRRVYDFFRE